MGEFSAIALLMFQTGVIITGVLLLILGSMCAMKWLLHGSKNHPLSSSHNCNTCCDEHETMWNNDQSVTNTQQKG